jgi:2,3-bisphosphoglycerate-dependent phosphoglycerate mutase
MSAAPTTLWLARHGESEWNHSGRITGRLNPGLSDKGLTQAAALANCFSPGALDAIYVSALRRTAQTAAPSAQRTGAPVHTLGGLDEIGMGVIEGRWRDARDPEAQALWTQWRADHWHCTVPGGEAFAHFTARVQAALGTILSQHHGEQVLIVGHGATNRVLLGTLLGWPKERWKEIRPANKLCYRLELRGTEPEVTTITLGGRYSGRSQAGLHMA